METLVGQALIEIRATWDKVGADAQAALGVVRTEIEKAEAGISASVGATVREVEASATEMAGAVKAATDEVGIAWVGAAEASSEFAVSQGEVRAAIRGSIADAQSFAASTDGMVAGFLSAERAGTQFATTVAALGVELRAVGASADEAFANMFAGFATTKEALAAEIESAVTGSMRLGAALEFGAMAAQSYRDAVALAAIQTNQVAISDEAAAKASAAVEAEIKRQLATTGELNAVQATRAGLNAAVAQSEREAALAAERQAQALAARAAAERTAAASSAASTTALDREARAAQQAEARTAQMVAAVRALSATTEKEAAAMLTAAGITDQYAAQMLAAARAAGVFTASAEAATAATVESASASTISATALNGMNLHLSRLRAEFNNTLHTVRNFTFVFAGIGAAVSAVTIAIADHVQKLYNMGQVFGLTASEISAFDMLAKSTGETVEAVSSSMRMLEKNFLGVGQGSKVAAVGFKALGIETAATGHSTASAVEIYRQMADTLSLLPDGETKVALGTAVMGRGFEEMIPVMNQGSAGMDLMTERSHALGTQLTTLDMLVSNEVAGMWSRFKESLLGVGYAVEKNLAPALMEFLGTLTQWIAKNRELLGQNIAEFVRNVGSAFGGAVSAIRDNASSLRTVASAALEAAAAYKAINFLYSAESIQKVAMAAYGLAGTMSNPLTIALTGVSALVLAGVHAYDEYASALDRSAQSVRDFQRDLDKLDPAQRAQQESIRATSEAVKKYTVQVAATEAEIAKYSVHAEENEGVLRTLNKTLAEQKAKLVEAESGLRAVSKGHEGAAAAIKADASATDTLSDASARAEIQQNLLKSAFRDLELAAKGNTQPLAQNVEGMQALDDVLKRAGGDAPKTVDGLIAMAKTGKLTAGVVHEFAQAFGVADEEINKALGLFLKFDAATLETSKGAHGAAAAVEKLDAQIAKIRAETVAIQIDQLSAAMKRMAPSQAMEQLPALMQLVSDKFDYARVQIGFETDALVKNAEKTKDVAQRSEMLEAAHVKQAASLEKLTAEESAYREKLVATSLGLEDGVKFIQNYDQTVGTLTASIESLNAASLQDQIKTITDNWKTLDTATRESQLPEVLDLIAQRYEALGKKAEEADQALLDQAQHLVDLRGAILDVAIEQGDANKVSEAANALQDAWAKQTEVSTLVTQKHSAEIGKLAVEQGREEKAARDAAAGITDQAQAMQLAAGVSSDLAKALVSLATTGKGGDLGKELFASFLDKSIVPDVEKMFEDILHPAFSLATEGLSTILKSTIGAIFNNAAVTSAPTIGAALSTAVEGGLGLAAGTLAAAAPYAALGAAVIGGSIYAFQSHSPALKGAVAATLTAGTITGVTAAAGAIGGALMGAGGGALAGAEVGGPIGAIVGAVVGTLVAVFGAAGPSMASRIAAVEAKWIKKSLEDPQIADSVNAGLNEIGLALTPGIAKMMIEAPTNLGPEVRKAWEDLGSSSSYAFSDGFMQDMRETGKGLIHSTVADVLHALYKDISDTTAAGIQQAALAAGAEIAHAQGLIGTQAIAFANEWAISFIAAAKQTGKSADEILTALQRIAGPGAAIYASLDALNADILAMGDQADAFFSDLNARLSDLAGKKIRVGNLADAMTVLTSLNFDAATSLEFFMGVLDEAGIKVEQFGSDWTNVLLAISGDAGTVIRDASADMEAFGNTADGTADILASRVVKALGDLVATADQLGYTPESIQAIGTAASLISPELLKNQSVVQALHDTFAQMAVGAHMSIADLIATINPPLPDAVKAAILSVDALGAAIGALSGAPLRNLKEVTDRMKQFAGEMYKIVEENGEQVKKLTVFGEQVVGDVVSAIDGMWTTINEDSWVGLDEMGRAFAELGNIPAEALNDPAIQTAIKQLFAKMGEALGDAQLIAWANADTITAEMIAEGTKKYDEYVDHVEGNPPVVPPPETPDGQPVADPNAPPTGPDTSAGSSAPPPAPVPPETLKSWEEITQAAKAYAAAVVEGSAAIEALTTATVADAAKILAAIRPIYGTPDDKASLSAIHEKLRLITDDLLGWSGNWKDDFDKARGAVIDLTTEVGNYAGALAAIPTSITTTITRKYVTEGDPGGDTGGGDTGGGPGMASGGWIPGLPMDPYTITAHGGELVVPEGTASTLPPDLVSRLLSGDAFSLPASMVARLSYPVGVPMVARQDAAPAASAAPAVDPDHTLIPVRKRDLIEGAVLEVARATQTGRARVDGREFRVSPTYGRRRG